MSLFGLPRTNCQGSQGTGQSCSIQLVEPASHGRSVVLSRNRREYYIVLKGTLVVVTTWMTTWHLLIIDQYEDLRHTRRENKAWECDGSGNGETNACDVHPHGKFGTASESRFIIGQQ